MRTPEVVLLRNQFVENLHRNMEDVYAFAGVGEGIQRQAARIALEQANACFFEGNEGYVANRTVECLHTYSPERLVSPSGGELGLVSPLAPYTNFTDSERTSKLRLLASELGEDDEEVLTVGFVDDVALASHITKLQDTGGMHRARRLKVFNGIALESVEAGTQADYVTLESSYVVPALGIIDAIKKSELPTGYRLSRSGSTLLSAQDSDELQIRLTGFNGVDDPLHPSCAVLDLAWLRHRLSLAPVATTIAKALSDMPKGRVESVFVGDNFEVDQVTSWETNS
jgi:hypothetical protein